MPYNNNNNNNNNNYTLAKPPPLRLLKDSAFSIRHHARSPSRPRLTDADGLLSDLSPSSTLAAFYDGTHSCASSKLNASIEAASPGEREFGIRAATAGSKIKGWFNELKDWPWPESGAAGFEPPVSRLKRLSLEDTSGAIPERLMEELYCGSLPAQDVEKYSTRIDEILDDMDELDVDGIKSHILDLHVSSGSRPTSSASGSPTRAPSVSTYTKMEDFTALITATVLQALPILARLRLLMDVWTIRLVVLRQINPLFDAMEEADSALRSGWQALNSSFMAEARDPNRTGSNSATKEEHPSRATFNSMQKVLQDKVTRVGGKLDRMLDYLEGKQDTLPEAWLDRMESLERQYADWVAVGHMKVLEGEWAMEKPSRKERLAPIEKDCPQTAKIPRAISGNDGSAQTPKTIVPNEPRIASKVQDNDPADELGVSSKRSSLLSGTKVLPENSTPLISQFDGAPEIGRQSVESSEPVTSQKPQTPPAALPESPKRNVERTSSPAQSSLKCSPSARTTSNHIINSEQQESCFTSDSGCRLANPTKVEDAPVEVQLQSHGEQSSTIRSSGETSVKHESKPSPATLGKSTNNLQFGIAVNNTTVSPTTPPSHILGANETTGSGKSSSDVLQTPLDFHMTPSVISTGSSFAAPDSSPVVSHFPRRVLSPIQSSADWFDFGDEETPTKDALCRDQDFQKTPTPNIRLRIHHDDVDGSDDEAHENEENSVGGLFDKVEIGAGSENLTPTPPISSIEQTSLEGPSPSAIAMSKRKSGLLASPDFSDIRTPEASLDPPMLPNVGVLQVPNPFSSTNGSAAASAAAKLQQQISEILDSLPTRIRLATEKERNVSSELQVPKRVKKTISASSPNHSSRSPTPTPTFTLAPAYSKSSPRPRQQKGSSEIKLYHLSRSNGGAPIKLYVRLVGENGERVMVRVGGGWADLGEYLREYAFHHSRGLDDEIQIHDSSSRILSSASISSARSGGRSSPFEIDRSGSSLDYRPPTSMGSRRPSAQHERPSSSLAVRKTRHLRQSFGEEVREARPRFPSTPISVMDRDRSRRSTSASLRGTPPSTTSTPSRSSSRLSFSGEDGNLGLSGPRSKNIELSEENEKWVEIITEKVKKASAEKEKKHKVLLGDIGTVGSTKRLFRQT